MDVSNFVSVCSQIVGGFGRTLLIFFVTLVFSLPLGLLVARGRMSGIGFIKRIFQFVISVLRGTPLMLQLIVVFYGPYFLLGMRLSSSWRMMAVMIGFSINYSAYFGEIFKAGFEAVPPGQMEAARSLGLTYWRSMYRVVLPQAIKNMVPSIVNQFIITLKDTSILSVIGFPELVNKAQNIIARTFQSFQVWTIVAIMYLIVILILQRVAKILERRMNYDRRAAKNAK